MKANGKDRGRSCPKLEFAPLWTEVSWRIQIYEQESNSPVTSCELEAMTCNEEAHREEFHTAASPSKLEAPSIRRVAGQNIIPAQTDEGHQNPFSIRPLGSPMVDHGQHMEVFPEGGPF